MAPAGCGAGSKNPSADSNASFDSYSRARSSQELSGHSSGRARTLVCDAVRLAPGAPAASRRCREQRCPDLCRTNRTVARRSLRLPSRGCRRMTDQAKDARPDCFFQAGSDDLRRASSAPDGRSRHCGIYNGAAHCAPCPGPGTAVCLIRGMSTPMRRLLAYRQAAGIVSARPDLSS